MYNVEDLKRFQVDVVSGRGPSGFMTASAIMNHGFDQLIKDINETSGTQSKAVATSIYMRRYGFFITAQLYLKAHNKIWDGPLEEIHLTKTEGTITFEIDQRFIRDEKDGDLERIIKHYGHSVVESLSKRGSISKLTLWENIWGYVLWMYGSTETNQAKTDLSILLEDSVWKPDIRTSMFRKFLKGRTIEEASADFKRVTCCLLKEVPNTVHCPYCPHLRK